VRWVSPRDLEPAQDNLNGVGIPATTVQPHATLHDALDEMLASSCGAAVVVDDAGRYRGVLSIEGLMRVIGEMRAVERGRTQGVVEPSTRRVTVPRPRAATPAETGEQR
jgi:osmoprotectant transport system ATP-binding protein